MYCKYCGNEIVQGEKICAQCGKSVNQDETDAFMAEEGNISQNHESKANYGIASNPNLEQQTTCKELLFSKKKMYMHLTYKTTTTTLHIHQDFMKYHQSVKKVFVKEKVSEKCVKREEIQTLEIRTVLDFWDTLCGGILVLFELLFLLLGRNSLEVLAITVCAVAFFLSGYGKEIDIFMSDGSRLKIPFGDAEENAEELFALIGYDKVIKNKNKKGLIGGCVAIVIVTILCLIIAAGSMESNIERVKGAYFEFYSSTITIGEALEKFCESPSWDEYDAEGTEYVKFSGTIKGQADVLQVLFKVTEKEVKADSVQINGEVYDTGLMMYGIYNMNYEGINDEIGTSWIEEESSASDELFEEFYDEEETIVQNDVQWEGNYVRTNGPAAFISVWSSEEDGVLFAVSVGVSGYAAYIDMRDLVGVWEDIDMAVYSDESGYRLSLTKMDDDSLYVSENQEYYEGSLNLSGIYIREELADPSICEFVFPESNNSYLSEYDCMGLSALECRIARNEIYARYGRKFSDESLQAYFDSCAWYQGSIEPAEFSEEFLNEVELSNLNTITTYEISQGFQ